MDSVIIPRWHAGVEGGDLQNQKQQVSDTEIPRISRVKKLKCGPFYHSQCQKSDSRQCQKTE